jgi:hypothetical protein
VVVSRGPSIYEHACIWEKEMIDEGRGLVEYERAEEMVADGFSKPYDPAAHKAFAMIIQGEGESEV